MDERSVGLNCVNSTMRQPPNWREADEDWAVAERLIGTIRRECVRPCRRIGRAAFAPSPKIECAQLQHGENAEHHRRMLAIGLLFVRMLCDWFKPRPRLEAEILILRHQLNVLQQRTPRRRLHLRWIDRALFIWLYRHYPRILDAMSIIRPESGPFAPPASAAPDRVGPRPTAPRRPISPYDVDELPVPPYLMIGVTRAVRSVEGEAFFRLFQAWGRGPPGKRSEGRT